MICGYCGDVLGKRGGGPTSRIDLWSEMAPDEGVVLGRGSRGSQTGIWCHEGWVKNGGVMSLNSED